MALTALIDIERALALFAEGIAGRPYHVKSVRERGETQDAADAVDAGDDGRSLYLPDAIAAAGETQAGDEARNAGRYRVKVLDQLAFREFGTYRFDIAVAKTRIAALADREFAEGFRDSDLGIFMSSFPVPGLARQLFRVIETARVQVAVNRHYPGALRYRRDDEQGESSLLLGLAGLGAEALLPLACVVLRPDADVYTSAAATAACYERLDVQPTQARTTEDGEGSPIEWLQREVRLEDWQEQLADVQGEVDALEFAQQMGELQAGTAEGVGGEVRDADADLTTKMAERDRLKRRLDMERATVRRALGRLGESGDKRRVQSFRYDEWDFHNGVYLPGWCRLYEERLTATDEAESRELLAAVRPFAAAVRRRFEQVRARGYRRVKKTPDGDELDLDAIVQTRADIRTGTSPDERVYSRRERLRRDVAAAFLVDLSASTDDILREERDEPPESTAAQDIRDPYFDDDDYEDFEARMAADAAKRRIIDIQREAVLLMATALEGLGDRYGVYGFSGYGRDGVEFYVAKELDEPFDQGVMDAVAAMKPKRSTRMGPVIRHAAAKLEASGGALKVLMIVSDGFPQDHDYGPERGNHEYGVQDTAKALQEAEQRGIETFCVTVDRSGHDYLRRMCPDSRYMVIEETRELPDALQKAYRQLTRL